MRVGLIVPGSLDGRTGGSVYDHQLAEELRAGGDEVTAFSVPDRGYARSFVHNAVGSLGRRVRDADVDVLVQDERCHASLVAFNGRFDDAPVVGLVHRPRAFESRFAWQNEIYRRVERRYLRGLDGVVCVSESTRRAIESLAGPLASLVAYPGGDRFGRAVDAATVRRRAHDGPLRVVCVGNVVRRKGVHVLLDGLERTRAKWELTVVGDLGMDPEYVEYVRRQIASFGVAGSVTLAGPLSDDELASTLERSHVLAVPSTYEGFGLAYVEGMGFGLPAIATTAGGAPELVRTQENGVLVDPDDPSAVTDAVAPLCRNRDRLAKLGVGALETFRSHPTWAETTGRVRDFLEARVDDF